jgi:hypothetical protein
MVFFVDEPSTGGFTVYRSTTRRNYLTPNPPLKHGLERWLALAVATYHGQVHSGPGYTPAGRWAQAAAAAGAPATVTRTGFRIDHVQHDP